MLSRCLLAAAVVVTTSAPITAAAEQPAAAPAPPTPAVPVPAAEEPSLLAEPVPAPPTPEPASPAAAEPAVGAPRLVLPVKRVFIHALLQVSLSEGGFFAPLSIAPDLWYGVRPELTVGLIHSSQAATGLFGGAGEGLCLTGESNGCASAYKGVGVVGRYHLAARELLGGAATVAADGGLIAGTFDPFALALKVGAVARWQRDKLAFEASPSLWFGVSGRDTGNVERFYLPISGTYEIRPRLAIAGQIGLFSPFSGFRAKVKVATSLGVQYRLRPDIFIDGVLSLPRWLDTDRVTFGLDERTLTVGVGHAF